MNRQNRWLLLILIAVALAIPTAARAGQTIDSSLTGQLQATVDQAVSDYNIAGAMALVRAPDGTIWTGQAGWADREAGTAFNRSTKCGIGSTTKTFTSTIILQLVQEGRLNLAATVEDVLPGLLPFMGGRVTLEDLLLMKSGLGHFENQPGFVAQMEADPSYKWPPRELVRFCDNIVFEPGDHYDYNNINYIILGLVIELLDGRSYTESLQARLLNPLGMKNTGLMVDDLLLAVPGAIPYRYDEATGRVEDDTYFVSPSVAWSSGAIYSTVDDLLIWMDAFWNPGLLSEAMFRQRMAPVVAGTPGPLFGLGYAIRTNRVLGFAGSYNDVFTSEWETRQGWAIIALTNGQSGIPTIYYSTASSIYWFLLQAIEGYDFPPPGGPENGEE